MIMPPAAAVSIVSAAASAADEAMAARDDLSTTTAVKGARRTRLYDSAHPGVDRCLSGGYRCFGPYSRLVTQQSAHVSYGQLSVSNCVRVVQVQQSMHAQRQLLLGALLCCSLFLLAPLPSP